VANSGLPETVTYRYDAAGRRVAALYQGTGNTWPDVRYIYDGLSLIEERNLATGTLKRRYYYEDGIHKLALVEDFDNSKTYVPLTDDRGTIMGVIDVTTTPTLVEKLYYNSTGLCKSYDGNDAANLIPSTNFNIARSAYIPFGWCGMYRDPFTGKYHTHFRDYDPLHNRWLNPDPAGYQDGLNLYAAYMGVNGLDPLGLIDLRINQIHNYDFTPKPKKLSPLERYTSDARRNLNLAKTPTQAFFRSIELSLLTISSRLLQADRALQPKTIAITDDYLFEQNFINQQWEELGFTGVVAEHFQGIKEGLSDPTDVESFTGAVYDLNMDVQSAGLIATSAPQAISSVRNAARGLPGYLRARGMAGIRSAKPLTTGGKNPILGEEINAYFQNKYGAGNVEWVSKPIIDTRKALTRVVERAEVELSANPQIARRFLTQRQYDHMVRGDRMADAFYGNAVEGLAAEFIEMDPALNEVLSHVGRVRGPNGRFISSPDFFGFEGSRIRLLDITTENQIPVHLRRSWAPDADFIIYGRR